VVGCKTNANTHMTYLLHTNTNQLEDTWEEKIIFAVVRAKR
jgi:hypothetical protein